MKVLIIDTVDPILTGGLKAQGFTVEEDYQSPKAEVATKLKDYTGIVIRSRFPIDADFLSHGDQLKFVARVGAGMENIDIPYAESKGIHMIKAPEGNRDAVGEHALGMLLMLFNNLKRADAEVREGVWKREANRGLEIHGKTVGIIGYGYMGSAFAEKLRGLGCTVLAYDKYKSGFGNDYIQEVSLEKLQKEADIVSLHTPQTPETKGMVNAEFIAGFAKPFYFINTARGKSVNTADLVEALKSGKILGACLDVLEYEKASFENMFSLSPAGGGAPEVSGAGVDKTTPLRQVQHKHASGGQSELPPAFQYLIQAENVILTPHVAGWSQESNQKMARVILEKVEALKLQ